MADGFQYTPGTPKLDGVPVADPGPASRGVLRFSLTNVAPGNRTSCLRQPCRHRPRAEGRERQGHRHRRGPVPARRRTSPVTVVEAFELNGAANDFKVLAQRHAVRQPHLVQDRHRPLPVRHHRGSRRSRAPPPTIFLGNLAADYDLTLYGPPTSAPAKTADETQTSVEDVGLDAAPRRDSVAPDLVNDIPVHGRASARWRPSPPAAARRTSRSRRARSSRARTGSRCRGTTAHSARSPTCCAERLSKGHPAAGLLRPGHCRSRPRPQAPLPDPGTYPADLNTIFLVAPQRWAPRTRPTACSPSSTTPPVCGMGPDVVGRIVPVDWDPRSPTRTAPGRATGAPRKRRSRGRTRSAASSTASAPRVRRCATSWSSVTTASSRWRACSTALRSRTSGPTPRRSNAATARTTSSSGASPAAGCSPTTSTARRGSIDIENSTRQLYLPRLAVGRLVESPEDIAAALERFVASRRPARPPHRRRIVVDRHRLRLPEPTARRRSRPTLAGKTTPRPSLINETWTAPEPVRRARSPLRTHVGSINAHFDQSPTAAGGRELQRDPRDDLFSVDDVDRRRCRKLAGRILFSMGCHSGLSVSDVAVGAPTPDWAQTLTGAQRARCGRATPATATATPSSSRTPRSSWGCSPQELSNGATIGAALDRGEEQLQERDAAVEPLRREGAAGGRALRPPDVQAGRPHRAPRRRPRTRCARRGRARCVTDHDARG